MLLQREPVPEPASPRQNRSEYMIYADNAATTKISATAEKTLVAVLRDFWGNPSSLYTLGQQAKEKLEEARRKGKGRPGRKTARRRKENA